MIVAVEVAVALRRPPVIDRWSRVVVSVAVRPDLADWDAAEIEAQLLATWIASARPDVVMAVAARVVDILEL